MFSFLEFSCTLILFIGIIFIFGKKLKRSKGFVTGLSIVLFISSVCSGVVVYAIPMPTESVLIEATGNKNPGSTGTTIGIKSVMVDGRRYPVETLSEGTWFYSTDDGAYLWLNEGDQRLMEPLTQEIKLRVPIGGGRRLVFLSGEEFGIVRVTYRGETETYDLFKNETANEHISFPDTNRAYDDFVKLCRLGGYNLIVLTLLSLTIWLSQCIDKKLLVKLLLGIMSLVTTLTFFLNTDLTTRSGLGLYSLLYDFNCSFSGNYVLAIILFPMLYKTFTYCGEIYYKKFTSIKGTLCIALPAGLFSVFIVIGDAFVNGKNTLKPIFNNELQVLKSLFAVVGYFPVFFFGITWLFNYLDYLDIYKVSTKKYSKPVQMYLNNLRMRPFITTFITLLVVYIPVMIASYPGVLMGDTVHYLSQIYNAYELNNAHPFMYTLFFGLFVKTGEYLFGSVNAGLFVYSFFQFLFVIVIISMMIKILVNLKLSEKIILVLILYYIIHPRIQSYMFLMTKDVMNAAFLLVYMVSIYMIILNKHDKFIYIILGISDLGAMLFRHDSQYVIVISLFILLLMLRDMRKKIAIIAAMSLSFALIWNNVLLPKTNVLPTHPWRVEYIKTGYLARIMVQQTARYIRDVGYEVTEEEKEIISACFDYDQILIKYLPDNKTDDLMGILKKSATQEDWKKYQKIWLKMFFKHPEIYLEATLNHKYQYLYPRLLNTTYSYKWSLDCMESANKSILEMSTKISYPENLDEYRMIYQGIRESFMRVPVLNLLSRTSSFFWMLFIWFSYCILSKGKISIALMMPLLVLIFALIAGPCNGRYFRYSYPYALCLPVVILLGLHSIKQRGGFGREHLN